MKWKVSTSRSIVWTYFQWSLQNNLLFGDESYQKLGPTKKVLESICTSFLLFGSIFILPLFYWECHFVEVFFSLGWVSMVRSQFWVSIRRSSWSFFCIFSRNKGGSMEKEMGCKEWSWFEEEMGFVQSGWDGCF